MQDATLSLPHSVIDLLLGIAVSAGAWMFRRFIREFDLLKASHSKLRARHAETRAALRRVEEAVDLEPYPYQER